MRHRVLTQLSLKMSQGIITVQNQIKMNVVYIDYLRYTMYEN